MGILASKHAGGQAYLFKPEVLAKFKEWLVKEKHELGGFMMWDSHWDEENGR